MEYEISDLVKKYQDKDFLELHKALTAEVNQLDRMHLHLKKYKHISEYQFGKYRDHAGDFLFFLNTGVVPFTIGLEGLRHFLPVIQNLVSKGQLKEEILNNFK